MSPSPYVARYPLALCEYPQAASPPSPTGSHHQPRKCPCFNSFRAQKQLAPPSLDRLHDTVCIVVLFFLYTTIIIVEKTALPPPYSNVCSLVQMTYHIRLLCLLTTLLLLFSSSGIGSRESTFDPAPSMKN